jgi:arabinofuranan 3-O-arabinosyltransferase
VTAPVDTRPPPRAMATRSRGPRDWLGVVLPAAIAYLPLLLTRPGQVAADTKTYLYLDPGKLLRDAPFVWDSQIGLGTVTHQNIGYLWPMGPFYWVLDAIGLPDWVAQRLWLGTVLFAAGMGVRYLLHTLDWGGLATRAAGPGRRGGLLVATLAYMLSPYLLDYSARISVILLPWAALPWLLGLTIKALRHGGWLYPALFALVIQTVGGINATALILIGLAPLLWIVHAVWIERTVTTKRALATIARIGALTLLTSLWWIAGLWAEGRYGLPVVRYTETYKTVASISMAPEVLRGLGYWFFYGTDKLGPWIEPSVTYTQNPLVLVTSYALPILALTAAALVRWRYRLFFVVMIVVGTLVAVGSHPWDEPSLPGAIFKALTRSDAGLAMRSTPRAVPLIALGMAVFLGSGVSAIGRRLPRYTLAVSGLTIVLILGNLPTLWTGQMVASNLQRPEDVPQYWLDAAAYLDGRGHDTRILEVPGSDFASYRWGNTVDPITPGLTDRGYVARELFAWGSAPSANLLNAFDRRFHEDDIDPEAIAPIARLMGAGDLTLRADLQYERFRTARPRDMWYLLNNTPGLGSPTTFGPTTPNVAGPEQTMIDEIELQRRDAVADPPAIAVYPVTDPLPIFRTHSAERPRLVAGDGEGLVDSASISFLDPLQASFYSGSYATDADGFREIYDQNADLLVTDTNRKRARRWGTLRENNGYTETAGEVPLRYDPGDQRLELFPGAGDDAYTVSEQRGGATLRATRYGNPVTYTANDRAALAMDGDPLTAWRVGAVDDPTGERLVIDVDDAVSTDRLTLLQPQTLLRNRWITGLRLHFSDGTSTDVTLDETSRTGSGQVVTFPERTFDHLELEITATDIGKRPRYDGLSSVGFAEVTIPGVAPVEELVRPPTDLLDTAGTSSIDHRLALLFTRLRTNPAEPVRTDEEVALRRVFSLPTERTFAIGAQGRLSAYVTDDAIDRLLGYPDASQGGITATSSTRLSGSLERRARAAIDGDPTTAWDTVFEQPLDQQIEITTAEPVTFDQLDLQLVNDGRHSVPTSLSLVVDGDTANPIPITVPEVEDQATPNATVMVPIDLPQSITGTSFSFTVDGVREVKTKDWYSSSPITMPIGIAELGIPGVQSPPAPATFATGCRDDLLSIDGEPVGMQVSGSIADALQRRKVEITPCQTDGNGGAVALAAGEHVLRTGIGRDLGIDIDRLLLSSDAGGAAGATTLDEATTPTGPPVTSLVADRVSYSADVESDGSPFWVSVGESWNDGWRASADGRDLGAPQVIDGYGSGWLVEPDAAGTVHVDVHWQPQRLVWVSLALSALGVVICLALIGLGWRRRRRAPAEVDGDTDVVMQGDDPTLVRPGRGEAVVPMKRAVVLCVLLGAFVTLNVPFAGLYPLLGVVVGLTAFLVYRSPKGRGWLGLAGVACLGLAAAYIVTGQFRHDYRSDFDWPLQFTRAHVLGLLAVFLALAEAVRGVASRPPDTPVRPVPETDRPTI